jgi:hypothetical protein
MIVRIRECAANPTIGVRAVVRVHGRRRWHHQFPGCCDQYIPYNTPCFSVLGLIVSTMSYFVGKGVFFSYCGCFRCFDAAITTIVRCDCHSQYPGFVLSARVNHFQCYFCQVFIFVCPSTGLNPGFADVANILPLALSAVTFGIPVLACAPRFSASALRFC